MNHYRNKILTVALFSILLFVLTWLLYSNTLANRFAFDDKSLVVENKLVNSSHTLKEVFTTNYRYGSGFTDDNLYRPLVILSFTLNKSDSLDPWPFHFWNITINALNSVFLFWLLIIITDKVKLSFISSILFSFHPIHTEAVANIAGRPEIMCAFFLFLSWIFAVYSEKKRMFLFPSSLFLFAALLSKETAVILPFMVFAVDAVLGKQLKKRSIYLKYVCMTISVMVYIIIRFHVLNNISLSFEPDFVDNPIAASPVVERTATAFAVFLRYCFLLILPARLSSDYSYHQLPIYSSFLNIIPAAGILLFFVLIAAAIRFEKRNHLYLIGLVVFLFPYLLVSNIFLPIGTIMGERLMYIPSAGFSLALGAAFATLMGRWKRYVLPVFLILITLYSIKTYTRNKDWADDYSLFSADLKNSPGSVKVLCNMGYLSGKKGNMRSGELFYRKALEIYPESDTALLGLGKKLYDQKRFKESARYYEKAADIYPEKARIRYDYGTVLEKLGRYDEAEAELLAAINLDPDNPKPYEAIGVVYIAVEEYPSAVAFLEKALELKGNTRIIYNNLAAAKFLAGNIKEAYEYVKKAESRGFQLNPDMVRAIKSHFDTN